MKILGLDKFVTSYYNQPMGNDWLSKRLDVALTGDTEKPKPVSLPVEKPTLKPYQNRDSNQDILSTIKLRRIWP